MSSFGLYKIGSKTITLSGAISGTAGVNSAAAFNGYANSEAHIEGSIITSFCSASWDITTNWSLTKIMGSTAEAKSTTLHYSVGILGATDSDTHTNLIGIDSGAGGTFSAEVICDVCLLVSNPQTGAADELAPFWNRIEDTPPNTAVAILYIPQPGSTATASLTIDGHSVSATTTVGSSPSALSPSLSLSLTGHAIVDTNEDGIASADSPASITLTGMPESTVAGLTKTSTRPHAAATATTDPNAVEIDTHAEANAVGAGHPVPASAEAEANRTEAGDRNARLECQAFYMLQYGGIDDFDSPLTAQLEGLGAATETFTGSFTRSRTQQQASNAVTTEAISDAAADNDTDSNSVDTYSPVSAYITSASLAALGDDTNARRLLIRGRQWDAISLVHSTELVLDDCLATSITTGDYQGAWSISGAGTLTTGSAGADHFLVFGGAGETLTRSFSPKGFLAGYRSLLLRVRADAASKTLTMAINGKEWAITTDATAGTWTDCKIDLVLPPNLTETNDGTDTRYPEDVDGYPSEGPYFGVGSADEITITGLETGVSYAITKLSLVRGDGSYDDLDFIPSFKYFPQEKPDVVVSEAGTTTQYFTTRFLHSLTDECGNSIDEGALLKQITTGGFTGTVSTSYTHRSILALLGRLNHRRYPGTIGVDLAPMPTPSGDAHPPADEYENSDAFGVYLFGGGLLARNASLANPAWFTLGSNREIGGVTTIPAQPLYDRILEWWPGCGDVFGHRDVGATDNGTLLLRAGTILRSYARGLVADDTHVPLGDVLVTLRQLGADRGHFTSRSDVGTGEAAYGFYATLDPFGQLGAATVETDTETVAATLYTRKRQRAMFLQEVDGVPLDPLTVDIVRRRIITAQSKRLACYHAESRTLDTLSPEHPPERWISLDVDPYTRQLWALGKLGSELVLYVSEDFGDTIWEVLRVTAKSGVVIADPVRGVVADYYEDAAGHVQQLLRLPDGSTVGPTAVKLSGVALTAKVVGGDTDEWAAGRHLLKIKQGSVVKVIAGQDLAGATFEPWIV